MQNIFLEGFHTGNALNEKAQHQQEDVGSAGDETLLSDYDLLYPGHIPTSFFQKSLLSFGAAATAILNPARGGKLWKIIWLLSFCELRRCSAMNPSFWCDFELSIILLKEASLLHISL